MLSPEGKRRGFEIGFFVMPVVIVQVAGMMFGGGGPAEAEAAGEEAPKPPPQVAPRETIDWTDAQVAAGARVRELTDAPIGRSPMYFQTKTVTTNDEPGNEDPVFNPIDVTLNGIMKSSLGAVALIDDRAFTTGDLVAGDWEILSISSENRAVVLRNRETGEVVKLTVPTAGE